MGTAEAILEAPDIEPIPDGPALHGAIARRVLVVDDEEDVADSLAELLRHSGHVVQVSHSGIEALTEAAVLRPEAIILDIVMPGLDGYQVARRFRDGVGANALLIAVTGYDEDLDRELARTSGFDYLMAKPVDLPTLDALLKS
jgi:CheY-like chemotaxis protein